MIGDEIEIVVIDIKGDQVKLGIRAPKRITVHRKEVYEEIKKENIAAMDSKFNSENLKELTDIFKKGKDDQTK